MGLSCGTVIEQMHQKHHAGAQWAQTGSKSLVRSWLVNANIGLPVKPGGLAMRQRLVRYLQVHNLFYKSESFLFAWLLVAGT